jgi:uncharacterized RDD family membrane protein YckC
MAVNPYAAPSADLNAGLAVSEAPLASRGARLGAHILDYLVVLVVPYALLGIGGRLESKILIAIGGLSFLALAIYQIIGASKGQTIGKRLLQIKVVRLDGTPVDFVSAIIMRFLVGQFLMGIIPLYGLVDALFIFREDSRCVHDLVATTKVIQAQAQAQ